MSWLLVAHAVFWGKLRHAMCLSVHIVLSRACFIRLQEVPKIRFVKEPLPFQEGMVPSGFEHQQTVQESIRQFCNTTSIYCKANGWFRRLHLSTLVNLIMHIDVFCIHSRRLSANSIPCCKILLGRSVTRGRYGVPNVLHSDEIKTSSPPSILMVMARRIRTY
jgi:hypothetical protein